MPRIHVCSLSRLGETVADSGASHLVTLINRGTPVREYSYYAARAFENIAKRINGIRTPLIKI